MILYSIAFFSFSILWLILFQRLLQNQNKTIWIAFVAGIFIGPIVGYCSYLLEQNILPTSKYFRTFNFEDFILYFVIVGPIEEFGKFIAVLPIALRSFIIKKSTDGMLLAVASAFGFAGGENLLYLFSYGIEATWPRIVLGNLGHAAYSVFWGYALGVVFTENASRSVLIYGLILASTLHGAYNYFLTFSIIGFVLALVFSATLFVFLFQFVQHEKKRHKR